MRGIAKLIPGDVTKNDAITRTFPQAKHWGLIEKFPSSYYQITERGREFLGERLSVPEYLWIPVRDVSIDTSSLEQAPSVTINDLTDHEYSDPALHIEEAISL